MRSICWIVLVSLTEPLGTAAGAQSGPRPVEVRLSAGGYVPLTAFGTVGVAHGEETTGPALAIGVTRRLGGGLSVAASGIWIWNVATRVRPTPACTMHCAPFVMTGGRIAIVLATLSWHLPTPVGVFSFAGGAGFKSYRNGDAITACDNQYCGNAGAFQQSLTNLAWHAGVGWRPRDRFPVGLFVTDVVSRYKTGQRQDDLLLLLDLRL